MSRSVHLKHNANVKWKSCRSPLVRSNLQRALNPLGCIMCRPSRTCPKRTGDLGLPENREDRPLPIHDVMEAKLGLTPQASAVTRAMP